MDDQAPTMPDPDERPQRPEAPVPDPHRTEPLPEPQEGMRPGAEPAVRPEQDEEVGPLEGLLTASGAQVSEEASEVVGNDDPEAESLLAQMGVEDENIEGGQLLGLVAATLFSVAALSVVLIYMFYVPYRTQVGERAEGEIDAVDVRILEAEADAKLEQYTREGDTYGVPVTRAMALVVAQYGSETAAGLPETRQDWNMLPVMQGMGQAVQDVPDADPAMRAPALLPPADGREEVGSDLDTDTVELIENDGDIDGDDAQALPDDIE